MFSIYLRRLRWAWDCLYFLKNINQANVFKQVRLLPSFLMFHKHNQRVLCSVIYLYYSTAVMAHCRKRCRKPSKQKTSLFKIIFSETPKVLAKTAHSLFTQQGWRWLPSHGKQRCTALT